MNFFLKRKIKENEEVSVALAGNPNVGKSTLFNTLTGMHRHTGNWAGKTVETAVAAVSSPKRTYKIADIPGTYSLISHSDEEAVARDYICFGGASVTVAVCDATSLEHSLGLVLQISEVCENLIVCLNLSDEAERLGIKIDEKKLSEILGAPVIKTVAKKKKSALELLSALDGYEPSKRKKYRIIYPEKIASAAKAVEKVLLKYDTGTVPKSWIAMRLIEGDAELCEQLYRKCKVNVADNELSAAIFKAKEELFRVGIGDNEIKDAIAGKVVTEAEYIAKLVSSFEGECPGNRQTKKDKIFTGKYTAFPIMLLLLFATLLITLFLSNYPSALLGRFFTWLEGYLLVFLDKIGTPDILRDALVLGIYRTTASVIAVMLPPMAIFFPMFTLLEDSGYLPRVAYNLDKPFSKCGACGKQALTMCMGLGCNAVGVSGARIIDSKREKLLAILTNSFMPCNGRFPMLISLFGIASIAVLSGVNRGFVASAMIISVLLAIATTFLVTRLLASTVFKGEKSSFTIELVPYRRPEIIRVVFHSLTTRVASILWRAIAVAAPMGLFIFALSRIEIYGVSIVAYASEFLEPIGKIMGLDGEILLAFILGIPANEIVLPILVMLYSRAGSFGADISFEAMAELFTLNSWSFKTALCAAIFALFHFPCSTTQLTVYKETGSLKHTALASVLPTAVGFILCVFVNLLFLVFTN